MYCSVEPRAALIAAALLGVAAVGWGADAAPAAPDSPCNESLCFNAKSAQATRTRLVVININAVGNTSHGPAHLSADRAEATGADYSHWVFSGHVHVDLREGQLQADTATVQQLDKRIVSIRADGMPARFERLPQSTAKALTGSAAATANLTVRGHADAITYDLSKNQVQLNGNSWFSDGCNEITSQSIVYNIANQSVLASGAAGGTGQVHGTIRTMRPGASCTSATGAP